MLSKTPINNNHSPWLGSCGPLLIAEIGGNHEGDFETAKLLVNEAIESGADCIKLQLYTAKNLVSKVESPDRHAHFKKFELTKEQHIFLAWMCKEANVIYLASVWDMEMLDWIDPYLEFYKVGSGDLTSWPLIGEFAKRNKPILLSTGIASMKEILETIDYIQGVNSNYTKPNMLCILQCTSMYPINDSDANLLVMDSIKEQTSLSVGYSDHTIGSFALLTAAIMGASVLEFHFTNSREGKTFRDHQVSLTKDEVIILKEKISTTNILKGSKSKLPQMIELRNNHDITFRRGIYPNRVIEKGEIIEENDLVLLRPAKGTDARHIDSVIGSKALRKLKAYSKIEYKKDYS